jgi:coniferyl-aldehyde dehydrogenase
MIEAFIETCKQAVALQFPFIEHNADYTSIINERHFQRLTQTLADAKAKGAQIVEINPGNEKFDQAANRKMLPALVLKSSDEMVLMQEEIFGPILPVIGYSAMDEVIDYINAHPRPLALYYFGKNDAQREQLITNTTAGGMTINDVITHVMVQDLPLCGVGASGQEGYHGIEGFRRFSHAKPVYTQTDVEEIAAFFRPPYRPELNAFLDQQISRG